MSKAEKAVAKVEQKIADLTLRKDNMENEIANSFTPDKAKQLKDLNNSYAELESQLKAANDELEVLIAKL